MAEDATPKPSAKKPKGKKPISLPPPKEVAVVDVPGNMKVDGEDLEVFGYRVSPNGFVGDLGSMLNEGTCSISMSFQNWTLGSGISRNVSGEDGLTVRGSQILSMSLAPLPKKEGPVQYTDFDREGDALGHGASGEVYRVKHKSTGKRYAEKVIRVDKEELADTIRSELMAIKHFKDCENLVHSYEAFFVNGDIHIIMEFLDVGSLKRVLDVFAPQRLIDDKPLRSILYQVLSGLSHLHESQRDGKRRPHIHRDIKPDNIMVNRKGIVKISDFGCLKQSGNTLGAAQTFVGTKIYMSPERLRGEEYTTSADIWSVGVVAYECATGSFPFVVPKGICEVLQAIETPIEVPNSVNQDMANFLQLTLSQNHLSRPSAANLLRHPLLEGVGHRPGDNLRSWLETQKARLDLLRKAPSSPNSL